MVFCSSIILSIKGLGLNFVQQVIEAHKGKIFVNSIEGEFTEFIIYLPLMVKEL